MEEMCKCGHPKSRHVEGVRGCYGAPVTKMKAGEGKPSPSCPCTVFTPPAKEIPVSPPPNPTGNPYVDPNRGPNK